MRTTFFAAVLALTLGVAAAPDASASAFSVSPTQIFLAGRTNNTLLTLRNDSGEPLRFQLSVFAWNQSRSGEIELQPTQDVVFFPALLTLQAGEERKVRVGSTVAPGAVEKTYRIFVEELPVATEPGDVSQVKMLTKMGIPIFIRPGTESASSTMGDLAVRDGAIAFAVNNTGTVHVVPEKITLRATAADGATVFEQDVAGWYILAGGRRDFQVPVPAEACSRVASVVLQATVSGTAHSSTVQTPGGACVR